MFEELCWDDERLGHIELHDVSIGEVLEVLMGSFGRRDGRGTSAGCMVKQRVGVTCLSSSDGDGVANCGWLLPVI